MEANSDLPSIKQTDLEQPDSPHKGFYTSSLDCDSDTNKGMSASPTSKDAGSNLKLVQVLSRYPLSEREQHIARLMAYGHTYKEIAEKAIISERTAKYHAAHIFKKIGVTSKTEFSQTINRQLFAFG